MPEFNKMNRSPDVNDSNSSGDIENKENRKSKIEQGIIGPMTVVYRDNDLFQEYVPKIENYIKSIGGEINFSSFPKGTDKNIIKDWYNDNKETLSDRFLLTDNTCYPDYNLKLKQQGNLDSILDNAFFDSLKDEIGPEFFEGKNSNESDLKTVESFDKVFPKIFKLLLEKSENQPKEINIIQASIGDHFYGSRDAGIDSQSESGRQVIAEKFKKYIEEAGFTNKNISISDNVVSGMDKEDAWVLIDRHNKNVDSIEKAKVLVLPFSNFIKSISEQGLLKIPKDKVEENLYPALAFNFKKDLTLDDIKIYLKNHYSSIELSSIADRTSDGEFEKTVQYQVNLIQNDKTPNLYKLFKVLDNEKISKETTSDLTRDIINKKGLAEISKVIIDSISSTKNIFKKLNPDMFSDIIGYEYYHPCGTPMNKDGVRMPGFEKYRIEKVDDGLEIVKVSKEYLFKNENGEIID